jgi:hypothetical protein
LKGTAISFRAAADAGALFAPDPAGAVARGRD